MVSHIRLHHVTIKVLTHVEHVVVDAKGVGHPAGIVHVRDRTAPRIRLSTPEPQGHPDNVVAGLLHKGGSNRRVDPTGHGNHHPLSGHQAYSERRPTISGITDSA